MLKIILFLIIYFSFCFSQCNWTASDGTVFDLSSLQNNVQDYTFSALLGAGSYIFYLNFCRNTLTPCDIPTVLCQVAVPPQSGNFSLGEVSTAQFYELAPGVKRDGFIIHYSNGTYCSSSRGPRISDIEMFCNPNVPTINFLDAWEEAVCVYEIALESSKACPSNCPLGFRGGNCSSCLIGYYGSNCLPCPTCVYGSCSEGSQGNGSCLCEPFFQGSACDVCDPGVCEFTSSDGSFFYNISSLVQPNFDYSYVSTSSTFYVNLFADTNEPCNPAFNSPVCMKTFSGVTVPMGNLTTQIVTQRSPAGSGVLLNYTQGIQCSSGQYSSSLIDIACVQGAPTQIIGVTEYSYRCSYLISMISNDVCPQCTSNRYGPNCKLCQCVQGTCAQGITQDGSCNCNPGWDGDLCDICAPGYYGPTCTKCNCPTNSFCDNGITQSGNCICFSGWQGKGCSQETIETNQVLSSGGIGLSVGFVVGFLITILICYLYVRKRRNYEVIP